ncbi:MAG: RNA methyltransferase [Chloroflexi bacterium]|nr:RNA methyltransferase [Chloroflexota bacterium]
MFEVQHIDTLDLPELAPYRTLRRPLEHRQQRILVAEGEKLVRRLLESDFAVVSVLMPEAWLRHFEPLLLARPELIQAYLAEKSVLERLTGFSMYQGVLAVGRIPPLPTLEMILQTSPRPHLFAAVDGVSNADNLGVLVRNCAAFGVQALLVGETASSPFLRRAVRSSMGTIFRLPVAELDSLVQALHVLRSRQVRCLAAHPRAQGRTLAQADFTQDSCLILGSEGHGITPAALAACDEAVAIPMAGSVDSLNVGTASAVLFYEALRQRGKM